MHTPTVDVKGEGVCSLSNNIRNEKNKSAQCMCVTVPSPVPIITNHIRGGVG